MVKPGDVPQTAKDAQASGWAWLTVECLACKHRREIKLEAIVQRAGALRLGAFAARLYCGKCRGRRLEFALGAYVQDAGQSWSQCRRIEFNEGVAVRPSRE